MLDIKTIDLNLLPVFEAVMKTQSVTRAGQSLGLSQPAMSYALQRLRVLFNDPLFVRGQRAMLPTPRARALAKPVSEVLDAVRRRLLAGDNFDPAVTQREFSLCLTDVGGLAFLPRLFSRIRELAPHASVRTLQLAVPQMAPALESGIIDLAIGFFPDLPGSVFQQRLYERSYVCICRKDHPVIGNQLTLKQYAALDHAVVRSPVRAYVEVDRELARHGLKRRIVLSLDQFVVLATVIEQSDLIATVPHEIAKTYLPSANLRVVQLPMKAPKATLHQYWHKLYHQDAANRWLRALVSDLFKE